MSDLGGSNLTEDVGMIEASRPGRLSLTGAAYALGWGEVSRGPDLVREREAPATLEPSFGALNS